MNIKTNKFGTNKFGTNKFGTNKHAEYLGFEQGPIRPPSESDSLILRLTRNCPWNKCTFCPVYKNTKFSIRPAKHVINDIDRVYEHYKTIRRKAENSTGLTKREIMQSAGDLESTDCDSFLAAYNWYYGGKKQVFLQDANSLIMKPYDILKILKHLKYRFPEIERITSYARSHTVARIKDEDLLFFRTAGLNRIHIGLESGSDKILERVKKGATHDIHIKAGLKVKEAGIELSEYYMPGLGGIELWKENAIETAEAINNINPDFIRLRTLALPYNTPLYEEYRSGRFIKADDITVAKEILLFLENLDGTTGYIASDHILNLFGNLEGRLPEDLDKMTQILKSFLSMPPEKQLLYRTGRRIGVFTEPEDMENPRRAARAEAVIINFGITPLNADEMLDELMRRFI